MKDNILLLIQSTQSWLERRLSEIDSEPNSSMDWKQIERKCAYQSAYEGLVRDIIGELDEN